MGEESDFDQVVFLNADFTPIQNLCTEELWRTPDGLETWNGSSGGTPVTGLAFPDFANLTSHAYFPEAWRRAGAKPPAGGQPEIEGGLVVLDKAACPGDAPDVRGSSREPRMGGPGWRRRLPRGELHVAFRVATGR